VKRRLSTLILLLAAFGTFVVACRPTTPELSPTPTTSPLSSPLASPLDSPLEP
jgi:hypothetical protein